MIMQILHCPYCQGTDIIRHGKTRQGKQRYYCQETVCDGRTFLLEYSYAGHSAEIKQQIIDMAMNASGIRDTARVLHVRSYPETNQQRHAYIKQHPCGNERQDDRMERVYSA